jgi:sarcosine oxidase gamma subunit
MKTLAFLSARPAATAEFRPRLRSSLERALSSVPLGIALDDLSLTLAKFEVRGDLDGIAHGDLIRIAPRRGLVLAPYAKGAKLEARLRKQVATVVDVTGALAALRIEAHDAATLMRRLTDLDLESLPAVGAVARVPALVRGGGNTFELFWPQEYGHYLARVVVDAAEGLGKRRLSA